MSVAASTGRRLHAALDLLDRQLRDRDGRLCGNVDDIELERSADTGEVYVTALLSGPGHLAYRLGRRRLGRWLRDAAVHSAPPGTDGSGRIPTDRIVELGPVIALAVDADELSSAGGERWVRDHIIANIPEARPVRMTDVTSCEVRTADGRSLGRVRDLVLVMDGPMRGAHAAMRVEAVLVGGSSVAVRLGYERGGVRGPAPVSTLLRWLERRAHVVPAADIEDWDLEHRVLRLRGGPAVSD